MTADVLVDKISNSLKQFGLEDIFLEYYKVVDFDDEATQCIYTGTATYNGGYVHVVVKWGDAGKWFALFNNELAAKCYAEVLDFGWYGEDCDVEVVFFTELGKEVKVHRFKSCLTKALFKLLQNSLYGEFKDFLKTLAPELLKGAEIYDIESGTTKKIAEVSEVASIQFYIDNAEVIVIADGGSAKTDDGETYVFWEEGDGEYKEVLISFKGAEIPIRINMRYTGVPA